MTRRIQRLHRAGRLADWASWIGRRRPGAWEAFTAAEPPRPRLGVLLQWGIGDAVLTAALLRALRRRWPEASLELIGKPFLPELFEESGWCDRWHPLVPPWTKYRGKYRFWERDYRAFLARLWSLRTQQWDILISPRGDPRETAQAAVLRARVKVGFGAAGGRRWLDVDLGVPPHLDQSVSVRADAAAVAQRVTGQTVEEPACFPVPAERVAAARARLMAQGYRGGLILGVCDGAGHPIRRWEPDRFSRALVDLPAKVGMVVAIQEPSDTAESLTPPRDRPAMVWRTGLADLKGLLSLTDLILTADSGVMHLASACGARVAAVFGPTAPHWYGPAGANDRVSIVETMPCRPCFDQCVFAEPLCMRQLSVDQVRRDLDAVLATLERPRLAAARVA